MKMPCAVVAVRCRLAIAVLAAVTAAAPRAAAQTVVYTFRGTVATATNPSGPWAAAQPGDAIRLSIMIITSEPPTGSTPTMRAFRYPEGQALFPTYVVAGPGRADFLYSATVVDSAEVIIADDDGLPGGPVFQDLFRGYIISSDSGEMLFQFHETGLFPPITTGLTGLDWPDVAALDPGTWASTRLEITGDFGAGPMVISGPIENVTVQDVTCWSIDFNEDGFIDFGDYLEFLNYYETQNPRADLCGCGIVDFYSYLLFLQYYYDCGGT